MGVAVSPGQCESAYWRISRFHTPLPRFALPRDLRANAWSRFESSLAVSHDQTKTRVHA
ncbi:hypothetical protein B0I35DRAFT_445071 [Stachybotrys elegans]|uniref:Uncharacterized protein n=1 Tax=Stachybotrys elegans TaxID=80388 RepID=A0A8K0WKF7_9HYPO|nr:hypothetical protein B0I35DRAFT_446300 [Stachybotrys elegans]KAH7304584.1 hypothetical protein B0I35DRAFT_445071 [Stachybotrys elegans]